MPISNTKQRERQGNKNVFKYVRSLKYTIKDINLKSSYYTNGIEHILQKA